MLRSYQRRVLRQLAESDGRVLLQMPTGSGKTITAVEYARQRLPAGPVWFVCHRREIVRQASRAFTEAGMEFGVIAPGHESLPAAPIQIASVYSLRTRDHAYPSPATIVWDEAHHMAAPSWAALMARYPNAKHVGLTATPERLDGKGLDRWFDNIVLGPDIKSLIARGHLAKYRIFAPTEPDLTEARIKHGDYDPADIDKIMNTPVIIGCAVEHYNRHAPDSRALVFATSIAASKAVVQKFAAQGTLAKHVDGTTPDDERDTAVADLAAGRLKVLSNVNVFTEGVDVPGIDTVILLRPTRSLALYMQMIGRGLRPSEGKEVATIFDHGGCVYEHGFADMAVEWSLEGNARKARLRKARESGEVIRRCPECSCAHEIAAVCPECGHEYASRMEVGEFDGVLYQLRKGPPPRCETINAFSQRLEVDESTIARMVKRGLPTSGKFVQIEDGLAWVRENWHSNQHPPFGVSYPENYEPIAKLAKRYSMSIGLKRVIRKDAPHLLAENGWVYVPAAKDWMEQSFRSPHCPPVNVPDPSEYISVTSFAKLTGVAQGTVEAWVGRGMPAADNGWPHKDSAVAWVRLYGRSTRKVVETDNSGGRFEPATKFAKRIHVQHKRLVRMIADGLPSANNGWVDISSAISWIKERQTEMPYRVIRSLNLSGEAISKDEFAKQLGVNHNTVHRWLRNGMPGGFDKQMGKDGWVIPSAASKWLEERKSPKRPPIYRPWPGEYEDATSFAKRIGVDKEWIYRLRSRRESIIPSAQNGWIPIAAGLAWVQANTKVKIPASAWEGVETEQIDEAAD